MVALCTLFLCSSTAAKAELVATVRLPGRRQWQRCQADIVALGDPKPVTYEARNR